MTAASADPLGLVGTIVDGKYEVLEAVGEGGFSVIYRAKHCVWKHDVALKCFAGLARVSADARSALREAFIREGEIMARLSSESPEIVQARDVGELETSGGSWMPYLVLEWLEGVNLDEVLVRALRDRRRWSIEDVVSLLDRPCRALARVHEHGIAHRDFKPANLFVVGGRAVPGATIKLLDFGVAKLMGTDAGDLEKTGSSPRSFTPNYGAPEQFDRTYGATGPWTDVFAAALVMVEMLTGGVAALAGETYGELGYASENPSRRPTPRTLGIEVSDRVEAVFARALAVDPSARYPDMGQMWAALEDAVLRSPTASIPKRAPRSTLVGLPVPPARSRPTSSSPVSNATSKSRRPWFSAAATAVLMGAAAWAGLRPPSLQTLGAGSARSAQPRSEPLPSSELEVSIPPSSCPAGMVKIPGGKFFMGTDHDHPALVSARPAHQVEVGAFCLDLHEVTVDAYQACSRTGECKRAFREAWWPRGESPEPRWKRELEAHHPLCNEGRPDRDTHPVNCVTWAQADAYCRNLGKRLPRESEWEFAARGSDGRVYPWGDEPPDQHRANGCGEECVAWREQAGLSAVSPMYAADDGFVGTAPAGAFPGGTTRWGPVDMVGNVFEWVDDRMHPYAGSQSEATPEDHRVIRGGAFNSFVAEFADPALRFGADPRTRSPAIGFRCATDPMKRAPGRRDFPETSK